MTTITSRQLFRQNYPLEYEIQGMTRPRHWLLDHPPARDLFISKISQDAYRNDVCGISDSPHYDELMDHLIDSYGIRAWTPPSTPEECIRMDWKLIWMTIKTWVGLL